MELKYSVGVKWGNNHTRFGKMAIEIKDKEAKELLELLTPIILKYQGLAESIAKDRYAEKGTMIECRLENIDTRDEYGDTLELCHEHERVHEINNKCKTCEQFDKPILEPEQWEQIADIIEKKQRMAQVKHQPECAIIIKNE